MTAQQTSADSTEEGVGSGGGEKDKTGETFPKRNDRTGSTLDGKSSHEKSIQREGRGLRFLAWVENDPVSRD